MKAYVERIYILESFFLNYVREEEIREETYPYNNFKNNPHPLKPFF